MRTNTSRYEPPKLTSCDKCGLHYYLTNAPHVCAEWTTGQPRTSGVETEAGSTAASKWQVSRYLPSTRSDAQRIAVITAPHPDGGGQDIIECLECVAEIVVTEHNQHAALVAERERLLRLLRPVTSPTSCYCAVMKDEKCWHCEARELLANDKQGGERR